jgi:hypothetical protein
MKYTRYIVYGRPVRPEQLGVIALPAAVVGMVALCGLLPGAMVMDSGRYLKLRYLLFKREQRNLNYIRCVLRSLDREPNNQLISLLKVA